MTNPPKHNGSDFKQNLTMVSWLQLKPQIKGFSSGV
jgi:hypothetical protein